MYQECITAAALSVCSYTDIRWRRVYRIVIAGYMALTLIGKGAEGTLNFGQLAAGIVPGSICILISWVTRQALGYGDSILILACGLSLGLKKSTVVCVIAIFLAGIWAIVLFCRKHHGKSSFPFVPFLLMALFVEELI